MFWNRRIIAVVTSMVIAASIGIIGGIGIVYQERDLHEWAETSMEPHLCPGRYSDPMNIMIFDDFLIQFLELCI